MSLLLDLLLSAIIYLSVPFLVLRFSKYERSKNFIKILAIINAVVIGFGLTFLRFYLETGESVNFSPAVFWGTVSYYMMLKLNKKLAPKSNTELQVEIENHVEADYLQETKMDHIEENKNKAQSDYKLNIEFSISKDKIKKTVIVSLIILVIANIAIVIPLYLNEKNTNLMLNAQVSELESKVEETIKKQRAAQTEASDNKAKYNDMYNSYVKLSKEYSGISNNLAWYKENIALVNYYNTPYQQYHTINCVQLNENFYVFTDDAARYNSWTKCPYCHN